jgi:hypothetical protein
MDNTALKVVFVLFIAVLAYYAWQQRAPATPKIETTIATRETSQVQTTTATTVQTAPTEPTTLAPNALPECMLLKTLCKQDFCYLGNALNRHNATYCERIQEQWVKDDCMQKSSYSQPVQNPVIEGRVFKTDDCTVYPNLPVKLRDETDNITISTTTTNRTGEYGFEAASGKDYGVYVTFETHELDQNLSINASKRYIVDFALSP